MHSKNEVKDPSASQRPIMQQNLKFKQEKEEKGCKAMKYHIKLASLMSKI